jgi:hypothetical protein
MYGSTRIKQRRICKQNCIVRPYYYTIYPNAPTITQAVGGNQIIDLSWNFVPGDGNPAIGFTIYINPPVNGSNTISIGDVGKRHYTIGPSLQNGTPYSIYMVASNIDGKSPSSNIVISTPYTIPDAPVIYAATPFSGAIDISWTTPVNTGGKPLLGYIIGVSGQSFTDISKSTVISAPVSTNHQYISNLTNGSTYYIAMVSYNIAGNSLLSNEISIQPGPPPPSPTITNIDSSNKRATIYWKQDPMPYYPVISYAVTVTYGVIVIQTININAPSTSATFTDLSNGATYSVTVTSTNRIGTSPPSAPPPPPYFTPYGVPDPPINLSLVDGSGTINAMWNPPLFNGGSAILDYSVFLGLGGNTTTFSGIGPSTMYGISGLQNDISYSVYVEARNLAGFSAPSTMVYGKPYTYPKTPTVPTVTSGTQSLNVSWTAPYDNGSPITGYVIYVYSAITPLNIIFLIITITTPVTSYTVTGLASATSYYIGLAAVNAAGASGISAIAGPVVTT